MDKFQPLDAIAAPINQANVDTDQIIPARFLSRPRETGLAECLFRDLRFDAEGNERPDFILNVDPYRSAKIVVGGNNFGCGSSRENAVWALHAFGIRAAIAPSFGDIFNNNSLKNGLLPVVLPQDVVEGLLAWLVANPGARVAIDLAAQEATLPDGSVHHFDVDPFAKHCLLNGVDEMAYTLSKVEEIEAFEHRFGRENA